MAVAWSNRLSWMKHIGINASYVFSCLVSVQGITVFLEKPLQSPPPPWETVTWRLLASKMCKGGYTWVHLGCVAKVSGGQTGVHQCSKMALPAPSVLSPQDLYKIGLAVRSPCEERPEMHCTNFFALFVPVRDAGGVCNNYRDNCAITELSCDNRCSN